MTASVRCIAAVIAVFIMSCDTEVNIAPVYKSFYTKYYGEDGNQIAVDLAVNAQDGTMVMLGRSESQTNPVARSFIVKVDSEGTVLWQRQLGGIDEVPADVEFDHQNNILVVSNAGDKSVRLTRMSQDGDGIDSLLITHPLGVSLKGRSVTALEGGDYLIAGNGGPELFNEGGLPAPADESDLFIYRIKAGFSEEPELFAQGGEHYGKIVKVFELDNSSYAYYWFGDSDRPFSPESAVYRQTLEVVATDPYFMQRGWLQSGPNSARQFASEAIEMPVAGTRGYLMVGSNLSGSTYSMFVVQYNRTSEMPAVRFTKEIRTDRSVEGVSAAYGSDGIMYVLGDEQHDNGTHDMYLAKLDSDGEVLGNMRFGSSEGNDLSGSVRVLPDQRVAVFGTMQLETQTKFVLTLISPYGRFSE